MLKQRQQGELIQADAFDHLRGLNITDSPFRLTDEHAANGYNFDYTVTGGFKKRNAHTLLNASPDGQLSTMAMFMHDTSFNAKTLLRAAGISLQTLNTATAASTAVYTDTSTSTTTIFSTTQPVVFSQFNTTSVNVAWLAGGGQSNNMVGGYNGSVYTLNGAVTPSSGSLTLSVTSTDGTLPAGNYYYAIALKKASTGAISNVTMDTLVTVGSTQHVVIDWTGVNNPDSTKYNQVVIYRSAKTSTGVPGFTVGNLVATVSWSTNTYIDTGANQALADLVPRVGNVNLDNSTLTTGTYNVITTWKRRLVTASGSTLYFSDVNKPESWPTANTITVPSGGNITALAVINFSTPTSSTIDEMLCVFKERELWVITGNYFVILTDTLGNITQNIDVSLKFVDAVGCPAQPLITLANGFLYWIDYRGVYIWDGSYKPIYTSRLIEYDFGINGDIDPSNLVYGIAAFSRQLNQVVWFLSSKSLGVQKYALKLDLRLTLPSMGNALAGRVLEGVFMRDTLTYNIYGMVSVINQAQEVVYASGNDGNIWQLYANVNADGPASVNFTYRSRPEDYGLPGTAKRFHKVIVWCQQSTLANLTLDYWTDYNITPLTMQTRARQVATQSTIAFWDNAFWDVAFWDFNYPTYTPVVFNLNGVEGDALTLEFAQSDLNAPIIVAGYSVIYSVVGLRK